MNFPLALIGLGNPGPSYASTRHNIGRALLFALAESYQIDFQRFKQSGYVAWLKHSQGQTALFYPTGYMNHSGLGVSEFMHYYRIAPEQLCIFHDELERKVGLCHLKYGGSARGHNGIKHIMEQMGASFWRLGIGIDHPKNRSEHPNDSVSDFVLAKPDEDDTKHLNDAIEMLTKMSNHLVMGEFDEMKIILEQHNKRNRK